MAVRMTHLVWRKGWAYFRFKLPDDLASKTVPNAWPDDLRALVNGARGTFKVELWKSLELTKKDEQRAKRIVATKVAETAGLIEEARLLLARGPVAAISDEDIAAIAARVHADRLAHDEQLRLQGFGLRLPRAADALRIPSGDEPFASEPEEPGLTEDDLGLLRFAAEKVQKEMQEAVVRMRPPAPVKQRVTEELAKRGADNLGNGVAEHTRRSLGEVWPARCWLVHGCSPGFASTDTIRARAPSDRDLQVVQWDHAAL
jgi:hypothetical protein